MKITYQQIKDDVAVIAINGRQTRYSIRKVVDYNEPLKLYRLFFEGAEVEGRWAADVEAMQRMVHNTLQPQVRKVSHG